MRLKKKVLVLTVRYGHEIGYDVQVNDDYASVQDYLDALNDGIGRLSLTRARNSVDFCAGCDLCCSERAPLTWIDVVNLNMLLNDGQPISNLQDLLGKISYIAIDGPVIDIMLRREQDNRCIFLNKEKKTCSIYQHRPLVCQAFICAPSSYRASWVWEEIVNKGEDELVRKWLLECRSQGRKPVYNRGNNVSYRFSDWKPNPFSGKDSYGEIMIKDLCPPRLWKLLRDEVQLGEGTKV